MKCSKCRHQLIPGDDYFLDDDKVICSECIGDYILDCMDWYDIADNLGFARGEVPEEKPEPTEQPIRGQMDMFGGVYSENA